MTHDWFNGPISQRTVYRSTTWWWMWCHISIQDQHWPLRKMSLARWTENTRRSKEENTWCMLSAIFSTWLPPTSSLVWPFQDYPQCMECRAIGKALRENHCGACAQRCKALKIHVLLFDLLMSLQYCKVKARAPSLKIWTGTVGMLFKLAWMMGDRKPGSSWKTYPTSRPFTWKTIISMHTATCHMGFTLTIPSQFALMLELEKPFQRSWVAYHMFLLLTQAWMMHSFPVECL